MSLLKSFLFCISLENGAFIMATYITLVNSCYIAVLMMILNSYNVLKESMSGVEKLEMLMVASCVNFLCYYLFGSLLLVIAVNEVSQSLLGVIFLNFGLIGALSLSAPVANSQLLPHGARSHDDLHLPLRSSLCIHFRKR
jgi:hypothetical protein